MNYANALKMELKIKLYRNWLAKSRKGFCDKGKAVERNEPLTGEFSTLYPEKLWRVYLYHHTKFFQQDIYYRYRPIFALMINEKHKRPLALKLWGHATKHTLFIFLESTDRNSPGKGRHYSTIYWSNLFIYFS